MNKAVSYTEIAPALTKKLFEFSQGVKETSLGPTIIDLINIRASQLNHCSFCLDMHVKEAKIHGERELRIYHVSIWRDSPLFSEKEKAILEWTEAVTSVSQEHVSEELIAKMKRHLTEKELVEVTFAVGVINVWNRLNALSRQAPGSLDAMLGLSKSGLS